MALETWLDEVCKVWGTIPVSGGKGLLRSYLVFSKAELPSALKEYPCAVTYVPSMDPAFTAGALTSCVWKGLTEIHVTSSLDNAQIPDVMRYYDRIIAAMVTHLTLSNKVQYFLLSDQLDAIAMDVLEYGGGAPHFALLVNWRVRESVNKVISG